MTNKQPCPGCGVNLPVVEGPTHRYIGASAACWAIYSALHNAGEPPLAPGPFNGLLVDAYAAQHPGMPSDQAIQSVAVHVLTLYGVLEKGVTPDNALWLRRRGLREHHGPKHSHFHWLTPPDFSGSLTVVDIVLAASPIARTEQVEYYVRSVWSLWAQQHAATIAAWYDKFVVQD